jgi:hypothetical protein
MNEMGVDSKTYPIDVLPGTPGDPPITHGSHAAATRDFGFTPRISPQQGIAMPVRPLKIGDANARQTGDRPSSG